jgi:hypothetical protein
MLLGCCHCGETPSESTPPSVSQSLPPSGSLSASASASASASFGIAGCNACDSNVMPTRYTIASTKSAGSLFAGCNAEYTGNFTVYHMPSGLTPLPSAGTPAFPNIGGTDCQFYSTELALKFRTATCAATTNVSGRRFTASIVRTDLGGSYRYAFNVAIQYWVDFGLGPSYESMTYSVQQDDILVPNDNAFNCLSTFTLPRTGGTRSLAQTGFPSSITATPG